MDQDKFAIHQKLISKIFQDRDSFYLADGRVDLLKVTQTLKNNGLLELFFSTPRELHINYKTESAPFVFTKMISDSLKALGYYYFMTQSARLDKGVYHWRIVYDAEYNLDPTIFIAEIEKRGGVVEDIRKNSATDWDYHIEVKEAKILEAREIELNQRVELSRPVDDYWVAFTQPGRMKVTAGNFAIWHPYIVLYDKELNILKIYRHDEKKKSITIRVPDNARYSKITDIYSVNNIKNGLTIQFRN